MIFESLLSFFELGGGIVLFLSLCSVWVVAVIVYKSWQWRFVRMRHERRLDDITARLTKENRRDLLQELILIPHVASVICRRLLGLEEQGKISWEWVVVPILLEESRQLRKFCSSMELVAHVAPLLGLLGTVLGMIDAFSMLEQAGDNASPSIFAGGIWKALLTTAMGLVVAIPALAAFNFFDEAASRAEQVMERVARGFFSS